jgi:hypothetical protein
MSAPDVNIEKQARRHRPALWAIAATVTVIIAFVIAAASMPEVDDAAPETVLPAAADQ